MDKLRVAVLMGGPSSEHDISLASGQVVCDNLNREKYEIIPIHIDREGEWSMPFEKLMDRADIAFLALHGEYGEDGSIQEFLDSIGIPYTGSSAKTSALGMNKMASSKLFQARGLNVPSWVDVMRQDNWINFRSPFDYPVIVKPADRGSSIGVSIVRNEFGIKEALCRVFEISRHAMVQQYIAGREVTCAVIEDERENIALPPVEVFPFGSEFFDYNAKYTLNACKIITPAHITTMLSEEIKRVALIAHDIIGASGVSRTDMVIGNNDKIYVLEVNTLPGLTDTSPLPQAANYVGLSMSALLDKIIAAAIRRYKRH